MKMARIVITAGLPSVIAWMMARPVSGCLARGGEPAARLVALTGAAGSGAADGGSVTAGPGSAGRGSVAGPWPAAGGSFMACWLLSLPHRPARWLRPACRVGHLARRRRRLAFGPGQYRGLGAVGQSLAVVRTGPGTRHQQAEFVLRDGGRAERDDLALVHDRYP